jgi:N-formylglutamate deformylase
MLREPFVLRGPAAAETPVIVEVPHASLNVPPAFLPPLVAPARALARDADLLVDRLYEDAPLEGATLLVAHVSRYVIDLNRGLNDVDAETSLEGPRATTPTRHNHGLIWRMTSDGDKALDRPLTRSELEERLAYVYHPYHAALAAEIARKKEKFGIAVLLAAHSMPSLARGMQGGGTRRADVVPGTRGRTSAHGRFIDAVETHARERGFSVVHDEPYAGGFSTRHYGRPTDGVHAVQVELARRLYLDEETLKPLEPVFERTRGWCRALVAILGKLAVA